MSGPGHKDARRTLADSALPNEPGNEQEAMEMVVEAVRDLCLSPARLQKLKSAVAGATTNAIEHGNGYRPEALVAVRVLAWAEELFVRITDRGVGPIPDRGAEAPNRPMRHAIALGIVGIALGILGAVATWGITPAWFSISLVLLGLPCVWLGGNLRTRGGSSGQKACGRTCRQTRGSREWT